MTYVSYLGRLVSYEILKMEKFLSMNLDYP